ncbi:MAG TPA: LacI family DNA-binding transcriptional regulator [Candidatus Hydrogenedentes bacterium]|nr:LacI family DNA-binding transcriptional regulator [Candidatus Hydrogenedentota bacterium]HNT86356.1 LacI family DNA-binding transcriptional regulator [Candidatus Hydrogenedentota bacterium]
MHTLEERPTLRGIARACGVSAKTVSLVLNRKPGVSAETRSRVLKLVRESGYHPRNGNLAPLGIAVRSVGVTLPAPLETVPLSQGFFLWLYEELYRVFGSRGYYVTFDINPYAASLNGDYARGLWDQMFRACILAGPLSERDTTAARIHKAGVPYLAMGRLDSLPELSFSTVDYEEGAYLCARFLIDRGHKRIGMLQAFSGYTPGVERTRGYRRAIEEAGLPYNNTLARSVDFRARNIANMVHRILDNDEVTALIDCSSTEDAQALREGARRAGRVPGKDFEVVAWTYVNDAAVLSEACAHLWLPVREAAADGMEQLAAWIEGEREGPIQVLYSPTLYTTAAKGEIPKPRRLFETSD